MNLHQLELFVAVAEHGSYTRAAEALYISQPSVSARIRDLEASLGQQLFEQVGRRIYLTDAGHEVLVREEGSGTRADTERLFADHGLRPIVAMELRHSAAIKQGVAAGLGVALLSRQALGLHLATGTLVTLDVEGLPMRREWHIVHLRGRRLPHAAAAFKEMLLESSG